MIFWQKLEGAVLFLASLFALSQIGFALPLWGAALAVFAPDLSFLAYKFGPKIGAAAYNAVHFYGFGIAIALIGWATPAPLLLTLGLLWLAHAGFDRALGYGLKSTESFHITHLGRIGRP